MIKVNRKKVDITEFANKEVRISNVGDKKIINYSNRYEVELIFEANSDLMNLYFVKKHLDTLENTEINLLMKYVPYSRCI